MTVEGVDWKRSGWAWRQAFPPASLACFSRIAGKRFFRIFVLQERMWWNTGQSMDFIGKSPMTRREQPRMIGKWRERRGKAKLTRSLAVYNGIEWVCRSVLATRP
jgi:hypothetical protein